MDRGKHRDVTFCVEDDAIDLVNNPRFESLQEYGDVFEVSSKRRSVKMDLPIQIGFWVYQLAKLRMLQFHYDCIDKYIARENYMLLEMDTDSLYLAIAGDSLDDLIRPDLVNEWRTEKHLWFPREHPAEIAAYDKRTPGS